MADDGIVRISTQVDVSSLRSGMDQAASVVQSSSQSMSSAMDEVRAASARLAEAQAELGASAAKGNEQAASALQIYRAELASAQSAVAALAGTETEETAVLQQSISARMAASSELRVLEGNMMGSTRAAGAFLSMLPGLSTAMQMAFPVFGAIALVEILGRAVKAVGDLVSAYKHLDGAAIKASTDAIIAGEKIVTVKPSFDANAAARAYAGAGLQPDITVQNASAKLKEIEYARELADAQAAITEQGKVGVALQQQKIADAQKDLDFAKQSKAEAEALVKSYRDQLEAKTKIVTEVPTKNRMVVSTQEINTITDPKQVAAVQGQLKTAAEAVEEFQHRIDLAQVHLAGTKLKMPEIDDKAFKASMEAQLAAQQKAGELIDEAAKAEEAARDKVGAVAAGSPVQQSILSAVSSTDAKGQQQLVALSEIINRASEATKHLETETKSSNDALDRAEEAYAKLGDAQVEAYDIAQKNANAMAEASLRAQEATHTISPLAAAEQQAALHAKEYAEALAELNAQLQTFQQAGKNAEAAATQNQIAQLQGAHAVQATGDQAAIQQQIAQPWLNAFNQINSSWLQVQNRMFYSTQNLSQQFAKMGQQILISIVDNLEKAALIAAERELMMVITHQAANNAIVASNAQAAAQSNTISAMTSLKQVTHAAATAAAKAYSAMAGIPVVGPILGAVAAATVFAAVEAFGAMASFDTGTGYVPSDGVAMLHQGEAVIPAPTMEDLRGSTAGGGDINVNHTTNINAATDHAIIAAIRRNPHEIANAMQRHFRQRGQTAQ